MSVGITLPPRVFESTPKRDNQQRRLTVVAFTAVPVGAVLVIFGYHYAAGLDRPDGLQFVLYWTGFLMGMMSLVALACAEKVTASVRAAALVGIGLFGIVPRLQRFGPTGSDEFIHLRQAMEAFYEGDVGHTLFLLPISKEFFGLHQLTSAFAHLSGMPLWYAGITAVALAHILSVLAMYQLVRAVDVPARGAAVGAVIYTLNPSWLYFNVGYSYESLALPMALWCLAATVASIRTTSKPAYRSIAAAVLCAIVLPAVHHLSSIMLLLILTLLLGARLPWWLRRTETPGSGPGQERVWPLASIFVCLIASIHFWWSEKYEWLLSYLSPAWTEGLSQLSRIFDGAGKGSGQRTPFGNTPNPVYEVASGYLYPFVVLALFGLALIVLWSQRLRIRPELPAFAVLGAMFFASMPLLLTHGGAEGAHRSWGYSFIGIAVVCGWASAHAPRFIEKSRLRGSPVVAMLSRHSVRAVVASLVFVVLSFGSVTLGVNLSARFPGSPHVGDDARSISKEGAAVAAWMADHTAPDTPVLADRYVSTQVGSLGRMSALRPSATFPIWELYMSAEPVSPQVLKQISDSKIRYFVVDRRMATIRPRMGYWFTRNEPGVRGEATFPQAALDRFDCLPWLRAVYAAGPLTVYEVNGESLRRTAAGVCGGSA